MAIRLEPRGEIAKGMIYGSPLVAVTATLVSGLVLFAILGVNPVDALFTFFISPISSLDGWAELFVKATPLVLIAVGLSFGFQANVWNIGAEGQLTIGALAGGGLALLFFEVESVFLLPAMMIAGVLGGMAWAAIPAL
ncbi:MAG: ABC transporter permease, partial [Rhodospirillales bacterium]|nr:ABC transporter permease [Rhodospirillales bacterium]